MYKLFCYGTCCAVCKEITIIPNLNSVRYLSISLYIYISIGICNLIIVWLCTRLINFYFLLRYNDKLFVYSAFKCAFHPSSFRSLAFLNFTLQSL